MGLLLEEHGHVRFFHENMLDHVFARTFAESDQSLANWIESGAQGITQRSDVRRVLVYQRGIARHDYTVNVAELLRRPSVRFLIKDAVLSVMRDDPSPTEGD